MCILCMRLLSMHAMHLVSIVCNDNPNFVFHDKFLNLMQALDSHVLTALTKFVFMSFKLHSIDM